MVISKRLLLSLVLLAMAGTGVAMYVGLQLGMEAASGPVPEAVVPVVPVAVTGDPVCDDPQAVAVVAEHTPPAHAHPERDHTHEGDEAGSRGGGSSQVGDFATNSGTVDGSQFSDGGFGDIGQQWWNVVVNGHVTNVVVTENGTADVVVGDDAVVVEGPADSPVTTPVTTPPAGVPVAEAPEAPATPTTTAPPTATDPATDSPATESTTGPATTTGIVATASDAPEALTSGSPSDDS